MERLVEFGHPWCVAGLLDELGQRPHQVPQVLAEVLCDLAPCQIEGLDSVGPLPNLTNPYVTIELLDPIFADVAGPSHDLHSGRAGLTTQVCEMSLGDRGEQGNQSGCHLSLLGVVAVHLIEQETYPSRQRPAPLVVHLSLEEHSADVSMHEDIVGGRMRVLYPPQTPALTALACPCERVDIRCMREAHAHESGC